MCVAKEVERLAAVEQKDATHSRQPTTFTLAKLLDSRWPLIFGRPPEELNLAPLK